MLPHTHNAPHGQLSSSDDGHMIPYDTRWYFNVSTLKGVVLQLFTFLVRCFDEFSLCCDTVH